MRAVRALRVAVPALGVALLLAACAPDAPQDSLQPAGPIAERIDNLFRPVFWIAVGIFVLVWGAAIFAMIKFRARDDRTVGVPLHGNKRLEIAWTLAPAILLAGVAIPTVTAIFDLSQEPEGTLRVRVVAHQWWWEYEYEEITADAPGGERVPLRAANELHIPIDEPVFLTMTSSDVIHSFWVPQLAGKQDVIPGQDATLTIAASEPGEYLGQCAEFCALSHANMRLRVIAHEREDFDRWVREQQQVAALERLRGRALDGAAVFYEATNCFLCHAIRGEFNGEQAVGRIGPDLTHFGTRGTFGGAMFDATDENLRRWLENPQEAKPGNKMILERALTGDEIEALIAFLRSLRPAA